MESVTLLSVLMCVARVQMFQYQYSIINVAPACSSEALYREFCVHSTAGIALGFAWIITRLVDSALGATWGHRLLERGCRNLEANRNSRAVNHFTACWKGHREVVPAYLVQPQVEAWLGTKYSSEPLLGNDSTCPTLVRCDSESLNTPVCR